MQVLPCVQAARQGFLSAEIMPENRILGTFPSLLMHLIRGQRIVMTLSKKISARHIMANITIRISMLLMNLPTMATGNTQMIMDMYGSQILQPQGVMPIGRPIGMALGVGFLHSAGRG
jgi:hypothetical protein